MKTLYKITSLKTEKSTFSAEITFNPAHPLFEGHFPGQPIVPGVVLVEVAAAVISQLTGHELIVKEASVIKFIQVVDPQVHPLLLLEGSVIESEDNYKADMVYSSEGMVFAKLKGIRLQAVK